MNQIDPASFTAFLGGQSYGSVNPAYAMLKFIQWGFTKPGTNNLPPGGAGGGYVTKRGIRGFGEGGVIPGKYTGKDSVPAMLAPGEVVLTPNQLKGLQGGVQNNQVNVGITMNNNSKGQAQVSGDMMKGIGALIGTKIQQTLLEEARPGGMLSADNRGI
jgi:hypothetical protein